MVERRRLSSEEWRSQFATLVRQCALCYPLPFLFSTGASLALTELALSRIGESVFTSWHEPVEPASIQPDSEATYVGHSCRRLSGGRGYCCDTHWQSRRTRTVAGRQSRSGDGEDR